MIEVKLTIEETELLGRAMLNWGRYHDDDETLRVTETLVRKFDTAIAKAESNHEVSNDRR